MYDPNNPFSLGGSTPPPMAQTLSTTQQQNPPMYSGGSPNFDEGFGTPSVQTPNWQSPEQLQKNWWAQTQKVWMGNDTVADRYTRSQQSQPVGTTGWGAGGPPVGDPNQFTFGAGKGAATTNNGSNYLSTGNASQDLYLRMKSRQGNDAGSTRGMPGMGQDAMAANVKENLSNTFQGDPTKVTSQGLAEKIRAMPNWGTQAGDAMNVAEMAKWKQQGITDKQIADALGTTEAEVAKLFANQGLSERGYNADGTLKTAATATGPVQKKQKIMVKDQNGQDVPTTVVSSGTPEQMAEFFKQNDLGGSGGQVDPNGSYIDDAGNIYTPVYSTNPNSDNGGGEGGNQGAPVLTHFNKIPKGWKYGDKFTMYDANGKFIKEEVTMAPDWIDKYGKMAAIAISLGAGAGAGMAALGGAAASGVGAAGAGAMEAGVGAGLGGLSPATAASVASGAGAAGGGAAASNGVGGPDFSSGFTDGGTAGGALDTGYAASGGASTPYTTVDGGGVLPNGTGGMPGTTMPAATTPAATAPAATAPAASTTAATVQKALSSLPALATTAQKIAAVAAALGLTGGGGGGGNGSGGGGGTGIDDILGIGAGVVDAKRQGDAAKSMLEWLNTQQGKIDNLYNPGTPEYNALWDEMSRKDAAAGRNSQYGPRSVDLAARIAQIKAENTRAFTTGTANAYSNALNQNASKYAGLSAAAQRWAKNVGGVENLINLAKMVQNGTLTNEQFNDIVGAENAPIPYNADDMPTEVDVPAPDSGDFPEPDDYGQYI
jgi:hypothetical protein